MARYVRVIHAVCDADFFTSACGTINQLNKKPRSLRVTNSAATRSNHLQRIWFARRPPFPPRYSLPPLFVKAPFLCRYFHTWQPGRSRAWQLCNYYDKFLKISILTTVYNPNDTKNLDPGFLPFVKSQQTIERNLLFRGKWWESSQSFSIYNNRIISKESKILRLEIETRLFPFVINYSQWSKTPPTIQSIIFLRMVN